MQKNIYAFHWQPLYISILGPWNHVLFVGIGGIVGMNYSKWEQNLLDTVNEKRLEKGMVPIKRESINLAISISEINK